MHGVKTHNAKRTSIKKYRAGQSVVLGRTIKNSFLFTLQYMRANKLRTALSLLGITVGVFTIIAIFVVVDSLKQSIVKEISAMGPNTIIIEKWPWQFDGGEYEWWKSVSNKAPDYRDFQAMITQRSVIEKVSLIAKYYHTTIKWKDRDLKYSEIIGVTPGFETMIPMEVEKGRAFNLLELESGKNVCVLGARLASMLFDSQDPIGQEIDVQGYRTTVIGVGKKQGQRMMSMSADETLLIPYGYSRRLFNRRNGSTSLALSGASGVDNNQIIDEARRILRNHRRLGPKVPDNFALNRIESLRSSMDKIFVSLNMTALLLGGFSVIIGGFGIANIMFVSVQERVKIIGIQKALGARRNFLLMQYLLEAVFLSLLGGLIGVLIVWLISLMVGDVKELSIQMRWIHVLVGCGIAIVVGLISGIMPARRAASLNPVIAIEGLH